MSRLVGVACVVAAVSVGFASPAGAASSPKAIPGASYQGKGTELAVDAAGKLVTVQQLPVKPVCKGSAPSNEGDYGSSGLGPFTIAADGSFTNIPKGQKPGKTQTVVKGRFSGAKVSGTVVESAFKDEAKGFDCKAFSGSWSATRVAGTGDTTKPGAAYAKDDFSNAKSGFEVFNEQESYAEYLSDGRFRIGTRAPVAVTSLRAQPSVGSADVSVTTGTVMASGVDGAGLVCDATDNTAYLAGFVSQDGSAFLSRYANGTQVERADPASLPAGLLKSGEGASNTVRLVCEPGSASGTTEATLYLNGTKVASASSRSVNAGKVGVLVNSNSGASQFTFDDFVVKKPRS